MAKISTIKFDLKGVPYIINVNCNKHGQFSANIPKEVVEALRLDDSCIVSKTLSELEEVFQNHLKTYKSIQTKEELFIIVAYQARGAYNRKKDGGSLFFYNDENYRINISFDDISNAIGLDFKVAIKETIDGKEKWFETEKCEDNTYKKTRNGIYNSLIRRGKTIPFNQQALDTLEATQEKFRQLSEMLFNFIKKDEEEILLTLVNNKLLQ